MRMLLVGLGVLAGTVGWAVTASAAAAQGVLAPDQLPQVISPPGGSPGGGNGGMGRVAEGAALQEYLLQMRVLPSDVVKAYVADSPPLRADAPAALDVLYNARILVATGQLGVGGGESGCSTLEVADALVVYGVHQDVARPREAVGFVALANERRCGGASGGGVVRLEMLRLSGDGEWLLPQFGLRLVGRR